MSTVLITGSNRGIGLEFAKQYAAADWQVLACCRHPDQATALRELVQKYPQVKILALDVTSQEQINDLAKTLAEVPIDVLINSAGILVDGDMNINNVQTEHLQRLFLTNSIAPMQMIKALLKNVMNSKAKKIIYLSSSMGSIEENTSGGYYAYRASKSAGNSLMKNLSLELKPQGIKVLMLHPGWVKTDMGGSNAEIEVVESVTGMRNVIEQLGEKTGVYYDYSGRMLAW